MASQSETDQGNPFEVEKKSCAEFPDWNEGAYMPYVNSLMESRLTILVDSGRVELFFMIIDCDCTQCISVKVNN